MANGSSGGYTLEQLLEWCQHDRLIEGYDVEGDLVVIFHEGTRIEYSQQDAHTFLRGIFTSTQRRQSPDDANLA